MWSLQLVEMMWEVVYPEEFNAMIKHELAEERKRDEFYDIEPSVCPSSVPCLPSPSPSSTRPAYDQGAQACLSLSV